MSNGGSSRRRFLKQVAVGSSAAALSTGLSSAQEVSSGTLPNSPVIVTSYPIVETKGVTGSGQLKIVSRLEIPQINQERILSFSPSLKLKVCPADEEFQREVPDAQVLFGDFSRQDLTLAKQLTWIQYVAAGVEDILWPELVASPIVLTNMQRIYSPVISETAIGLLLALARGIYRYALQTHDHLWQPLPGLNEISGLTMGIVGLGGIGTDTAYRAHYGFNMRILAVDPKPIPKPAFVAELHSPDWLPTIVPQVDVLVSAAPHTPVTRGMFNASVFHAMKPSAYFINVSRGKLVDPPALLQALREGWIAGAGLDVAHEEPLPSDNPLWSAPHVIITSHSSAQSPLVPRRQIDLFTENVRRYVAGLPLLNVVDKKRGY
jgi:phosphoglycerate dehydrogenase-like enzyme